MNLIGIPAWLFLRANSFLLEEDEETAVI